MQALSPKKPVKWLLQTYARSRSKRLEVLLKNAELCSAQEEWEKAIKSWTKIINGYPKLAPVKAYMQLSFAYRKLKRYEAAQKIIHKGLRAHPGSLSLFIERAETAMSQEDWAQATAYWRDTVKTFKVVPPGLFVRLAVSLRSQGEIKAAEKSLEKATAQQLGEDTQQMMQAEYAEISMSRGNIGQALERWQKLLKDFHKNPYIQETSKLIRARFYTSVLERTLHIKSYTKVIRNYRTAKQKTKRNIAIFTAISAGYDSLKLPEYLDARFDYILFTDETQDPTGIFEIRPLPYRHKDKTREARFVKTHAHTLLKTYNVAVWIDANIMITGDIYPIINDFLKSKKSMAAIPHPIRKDVYEEAEACLISGKDNARAIKRQMHQYKKEGITGKNLIESNIMIFKPQERAVATFLDSWWEQLNTFSRRDQLSLPYVVEKNHMQWHRLTEFPNSARNHPLFILVPHAINSQPLQKLAIMVTKGKNKTLL